MLINSDVLCIIILCMFAVSYFVVEINVSIFLYTYQSSVNRRHQNIVPSTDSLHICLIVPV